MDYPKYYSATLAYNQGKSALICGGQGGLEGTLQMAFKDALYLLGRGYDDVEIDSVETGCMNCGGQGQVLRKSVHWVKCPVCKGKGVSQKVIGAFTIQIPTDTVIKGE